jgi:hypothetical protein
MNMALMNAILARYHKSISWWEQQSRDYQNQIVAAYNAGSVQLPLPGQAPSTGTDQ